MGADVGRRVAVGTGVGVSGLAGVGNWSGVGVGTALGDGVGVWAVVGSRAKGDGSSATAWTTSCSISFELNSRPSSDLIPSKTLATISSMSV